MSITLPDKLIVDSRMCLSDEGKAIEIKRGADNLSVNLTNSQQASNSTIIWVLQPPKGRTVIDPLFLVQIPIQVTVSAPTHVGTNLDTYLADNFALRQYPINNVLNNISLTMNNQTFSSAQPYQWLSALSRFEAIDFQTATLRQSMWPIMPDQSPQYSDLAGSGKSPLLSYVSGTDPYMNARGVFNSAFQTVSVSATQWIFNTTLIEPLFVPILDNDPSKKRVGFPHINSIQIQLTFLSNLSRMFSLDTTTASDVSSVDVQIQGPATLRQQWLTVPTNLKIPSVNIRSYNSLTCIPSQLASFAAGETRTVTSQSLTFNQIPNKIWIYVREAQIDSPTGYANTDTFFNISNLQITFNNKPGLMSNMNGFDLYQQLEAEKGSVMSYTASTYFTGNVFCADCCESFGLQNDESAGVEGNYQFMVQMTCTNLKSSAVIPSIYVVYANDTICAINEYADTTLQQNFVKREYVIASSNKEPYPAKFLTNDIYGGNLWDSIKSGFSKAFNFIKDNKLLSSAARLAAPLAGPFAPALSTVGAVSGALGLGNNAQGGKRMTRRQMLQNQKYLAY